MIPSAFEYWTTDGIHIFFNDYALNGHVESAPFGTSAGTPISPVEAFPTNMAYANGKVVWGDENAVKGTLMRALNLADNSYVAISDETNSSPDSIVLDSTASNVWWASHVNGSPQNVVYTCAVQTACSRVTLVTLQAYVRRLALAPTGSFLYVASDAGLFGVDRATPTANAPPPLDSAAVAAVAASDTKLFWIANGKVLSMPLPNGTVGPATTTTMDKPTDLIVVGQYLYVSDSADATIVRVPVRGGAGTVLYRGNATRNMPSTLATDGTYVYWEDDTLIYRVPR
jgi:hypothetical protein